MRDALSEHFYCCKDSNGVISSDFSSFSLHLQNNKATVIMYFINYTAQIYYRNLSN